MRKSTPKKRVVLPDPIFNEVMVTKFVNHSEEEYDEESKVIEED